MPKEEWGVKRVCPKTGKRFYDLNKSPVISPYTGEVVDLETSARKAPAASAAPAARTDTKKKAAEPVAPEEEILAGGAESDADIDEDLLEDEEDDVALDELADVASDDDDT